MIIQNDTRTEEQKAADWDALVAEIRRDKIAERTRLEQMIAEGRGEEYRRECLAAIGITTTRDTGKWELIGINATEAEIDKILEKTERNQ